MAELSSGQAEELLHAGDLSEALNKLQEQIRHDPSDAKYRVFLFQLLSVLGQWDRALTQLNVAAELDATNLLMAQMCSEALSCEALRREIFAGTKSPLIFGKPEEWVGWVIQANQLTAQGKHPQAQELRDKAFEAAPTVSGKINNETPFEWLADADSRMGPILEAIINGKYYWVPLNNIHDLQIDPPADLRDFVWIPAHFTWTNGGQVVGLIPTRYPGSDASDDNQILLARKTAWVEQSDGFFTGLGQRMLTTDVDEYPILGIRQITFDNTIEDQQPVEESREAGDG